jgi:hypothetical protein
MDIQELYFFKFKYLLLYLLLIKLSSSLILSSISKEKSSLPVSLLSASLSLYFPLPTRAHTHTHTHTHTSSLHSIFSFYWLNKYLVFIHQLCKYIVLTWAFHFSLVFLSLNLGLAQSCTCILPLIYMSSQASFSNVFQAVCPKCKSTFDD